MVRQLDKYLLLGLSLLLSGCSDDSYRGVEDEVLSGTEKIPVLLTLGDPAGDIMSRSATKGLGSVDSSSDLRGEGKCLYVFGFSNSEDASFRSRSEENPISCLMDASVDVKGAVGGRKASVTWSDTFLDWTESDAMVYWPMGEYGAIPYNFFAYYLDDIDISDSDYIREEDRVAVSLEIDGNNDLLSGMAELTDSQINSFPASERPTLTEYAFSYYTAIRDVNPKFNLKHNLVRLDFELIPGVTDEVHKQIYVQDITAESKTKAEFTVASKDLSRLGLDFSGPKKVLHLKERGGAPLSKDTYCVWTRSDVSEEIKTVTLPGSFFLAPDFSYPMVVDILEMLQSGDGSLGDDGDGKAEGGKRNNEFILTYGSEGFKAGNRYKVKLTLTGNTNVSVEVTMLPWEFGGSLTIDESDKPPVIE